MPRLSIESPDWTLEQTRPRATRGGARGAAGARDDFPEMFLTADSEVAEQFAASPKPATRARAAAPGPLDVSYELGPGETAILAVRHPSGALTFHRPVQATTRSRGGPSRVRFVVPVTSVARPSATRGPATRVIKAFIIKVAEKAVDGLASLVLAKLVARVEAVTWKSKGLQEGWLEVAKETLAAGRLRAGLPSSTERSLLLIHGTFSNAASAYRSLADSNFFSRVRGLYGNRIYAFDHFSLSRTPEENVRMLLQALPDQRFRFDVVTHSRGGLVLRNLAERPKPFDALAKRFELGRAVLVASPNEGTPLATPGRWENTVGWMANLLELFPENPFTTGAAFVANGLVWIARHASGDLPGLHSMDGDGELIAELQKPPGPDPDAYSALVANYQPDERVLMRLVDTGVDQFFGSANDLVVPSEGGWRIDRTGGSFIPGARIGCFGPGGNLRGDSVTHVDFFAQPAAVDFLVTALSGERQPLSPIDPIEILPSRQILRAGGAGVSAPTARIAGRTAAPRRGRFGDGGGAERAPGDDGPCLRVTVVNGDLTFERLPLLIGHYQATKLTGAEKVIDAMIGGEMGGALALGDYPFEPGSHQIFVNRRWLKPWLVPRPKAVIVVGLGQESTLRGAELSRTVCQGVVAWVRKLVEESAADSAPSDEPVPIELAATLIGSGGTGIAAGQAAQLIAQGVRDANDRLRAASSPAGRRWPQVSRLRLVELYLERAGEAWNALQLQASATPGRYALDRVIERGTGPLPRPLNGGYRGAEYDFITATTRTTDTKEVEIEYALDTKRARTEIRALTPQGRLLRDLVATASSDANTDKRIGSTLFQLLIPVDIEPFLADSIDMQIALDSGTAGIPWELLDDTGGKDGKREPWAIRCKLLRKLELRNYRPNVRDADGDAYALVIGEPECPDDYGPLPGAREEARRVGDRLSKPGMLRGVRKLISDDGSPGPNARAVVDTLFERDWRVVHIAGHGALPEDGSTGGVVLSNGTFIGPAEIRAMRVVPELVFVNCCHLGASPNESVLADGRADPSRYDRAQFASSVAGELIAIGVRCVIAAGWAVDDAAAEDFASTFYGQLLEGDRFIDAVALARRAARKYDGNTWAAYQCYGDPDWRLVREVPKDSSKPPEREFEGVTSVAMLELALETLRVQKIYQGYDSTYQLARIRKLEERWREAKWSASDGVAELFAGVYAALGDLDKAIEWYDCAADVADGNVSLRALEQLANLQVRRAWSALGSPRKTGRTSGAGRAKPLEAARKTIREGAKMLARLMEFRPTAERANLCGSAMKRLALVEAAAGRSREELLAIEEMKKYYKRGADLCAKDELQNLFYPASNYVAAELALHAGKKGWKFGDPALLDATRKSLADKNRDDPDFWSIVGEIEIALYAAVAEGELAKKWREELDERYDDLYTRMRGGSDWASVYDTAAFVLSKYRERAATPERHAADAVLAKLKEFTSSDRRERRRKG